MPVLENDIVKLRAVEPEDIELLYNWENDTDNWMISNTIVPFSRYILRKFVENSFQDIYELKQMRLMIDEKQLINGKCLTVGSVDLFDFDPFHQRAGIGILIHAQTNRRKHFATYSLQLLINYCFDILKLHQVYCNILAENEASIKLFTNLGFEKVGIKKQWVKSLHGWSDEVMFQLINPAFV